MKRGWMEHSRRIEKGSGKAGGMKREVSKSMWCGDQGKRAVGPRPEAGEEDSVQ